MLVCLLAALAPPAFSQAPAATVAVPRVEVRQVVMKDAQAAEKFVAKLQDLQSQGLFRADPTPDPKQPKITQLSFQAEGNNILIVGEKALVDAAIQPVRLMAALDERPHSHLQLNARVVQLSGPANANVIQMTETVRALVEAQREEVVTAFADLQRYLIDRLKRRKGPDLKVYEEVRKILPALADDQRPLTVPEILLLVMLDRSLPALPADSASLAARENQNALTALPRQLGALLADPNRNDAAILQEIEPALAAWKQSVTAAREWCDRNARDLDKQRGQGVNSFQALLKSDLCPLPPWIALRMERSLELTERLYPDMAAKQTKESLAELSRRFDRCLDRVNSLLKDLARAQEDEARAAQANAARTAQTGQAGQAGAAKASTAVRLPSGVDHALVALQTAANQLVSAPMALFDAVAAATDSSAPTSAQLIQMIHQYAEERGKLSAYLEAPDQSKAAAVNYAKLETLESGLNLWLRRASEAMSRALDEQFYSGYVEQLRLLANRTLARSSNRDILSVANIEEVPDVARDLLLADAGVNVFVSNSISLQFAQDVTNSVSAKVQARLPENSGLSTRIQNAAAAADSLQKLQDQYKIPGEDMIRAILAGGQAVPVQSGIDLSAKPSISFDGSTVTLTLTVNQTLAPDNDHVTDRVTQHSINNATITALSYEPMVLSTLASNISYYENVGGIPVLRKIPGIKDLLNDIPFAPFKTGKRQKGVYQSSMIILEPIVIPTIEDLVSFHSGWAQAAASN